MKYPDMPWGIMEAVINKLGGMDGVQRFLAGELVVKPIERVFAVWQTITLGLHSTPESYIAALEAAGFKIDKYARSMLPQVAISHEQIVYELFVATTAEIGFSKGATFAQICERIIALGYEKCPAEIGLAARLAYKDQPLGDWRRIVMDTITDSDGSPDVFSIGHGDDGRWLSSYWINPGNFWYHGNRWVFCRRVSPSK